MATHQLAKGLASLGRHGDSMLVHMTPSEVAGLKAIGAMTGRKLTTNPYTGMPEAFSLGDFFTSLIPTGATDQAYSTTGPVNGIYMLYEPAQTVPYAQPSIPSAIGAITFVSRL